MNSARPEIMVTKAGGAMSALILPLLFTAAHSTSLQPRLDHIPLGLPYLPPGLFITYTGALTGSFQLDPSNFPFDATQCAGGSGTYFFADAGNSTLRIGVNPPSIDPNPVFFMIQQAGPELPPPAPGPETGPSTPNQAPTAPTSPTPPDVTPLTWTPSFGLTRPTVIPIPIFSAAPRALQAAPGKLDARQAEAVDPVVPPGTTRSGGVENLLFASLFAVCTEDSRPCGTIEFHTEGQGAPTYHALPMLDLTSSGLLAATANSDGGASYTLRGDQSTWAGNGTIDWSGLEFSPPANYTNNTTDPQEPEACTAFRYPPLVWNATTPFTYDLVFSNTSATLSLVLTAPLGKVTLRLAGARTTDALIDGGAEAGADAIQVGSGAGGAPRWSFVNGTGFHFDGMTPVANTSIEDGGLFNGQNGLGSGAAGVSAGWGCGAVVAVAVGFAGLLLECPRKSW